MKPILEHDRTQKEEKFLSGGYLDEERATRLEGLWKKVRSGMPI